MYKVKCRYPPGKQRQECHSRKTNLTNVAFHCSTKVGIRRRFSCLCLFQLEHLLLQEVENVGCLSMVLHVENEVRGHHYIDGMVKAAALNKKLLLHCHKMLRHNVGVGIDKSNDVRAVVAFLYRVGRRRATLEETTFIEIQMFVYGVFVRPLNTTYRCWMITNKTTALKLCRP